MRMDFVNKESKLFQDTIKIVNKYDIMGLISGFLNDLDEYEAETVEIINRCYYEDDIDKMANTIKEIFNYWFAPLKIDDNQYNKIRNMAVQLRELFDKYQKKQYDDRIWLIRTLRLLEEVHDYYHGNGKYNLSHLDDEEKIEQAKELWNDIISKINKTINDVHVYLKGKNISE
ncbi:DUF1871 family protein [Paraclostridium dentum]|uniref:DUF1871 family protein n=1 Tax=Paraclostridium dentum TaxID=2662455 RepID=UPI003464E8CC